MSNVPKLRFSEFTDRWRQTSLKELTHINQGLQIPIADRLLEQVADSFFYITNEFLKVGSAKKYFIKSPPESVICDEDDVLMTRTGNTGQVVTGVVGAFHNNFFKIKYSEELDKSFLVFFLRLNGTQRTILNYAGASTIPDLNHGDFYRIKIDLPTLPEQKKIAAFLTAVDSKIEQLTQKEALLEEYKKGVMQKIVSQEIRFKADDGSEFPNWEEKRLSDVLHEHKCKSTGSEKVFSVSVHKGLVNQVEHLGRSFAATDTSNYNLVKPNDIVYTKSPTGDFPYGIIKQSRVDTDVLVSPLYGVFTPESVGLGYMLHVYFESVINTHNYLHSIIQKGAKNTINITNTTFTSKSLKLPRSRDEQNKIGKFLSTIDTKIHQNGQQLEAAKTFKKGLLQQMFV